MTLYEQQIEASRRLRMHLYAFTSLRHSIYVERVQGRLFLLVDREEELAKTRAQVWADLQEWAALLTQEAQQNGSGVP